MTVPHNPWLTLMIDFFGRKSAAKLAALEKEVSELKAPKNDATGISITSLEELSDLFGVSKSITGMPVSAKSSLKVSIVYACTRLIAGAIAQCSRNIFEEQPSGERKRVKHDYYDLLNTQPTPTFASTAFWEYITSSVLLHGDAFAPIIREYSGKATEIIPLPSDSVGVELVSGRLRYHFQIDGRPYAVDQDDMLHFPGFGFNGMRSMSVIRWGAHNSIGLEMAMEEYSGDFFQNGAHQNFALIKKGRWGEEQRDAMRESWVKTYGGMDKKRYPLVFDDTVDLKGLTINAKDSQLLESRDFQITDIARAFGLPSFMVNQEAKNTSFGSGVAEIGLVFLRYTLMPHILRDQDEANRKLFARTPYFVEFNTSALMRSTLKERNEAYRQAIGGSQGPGWLATNEIRRYENLPRIDNPIFDEPYDPRIQYGVTESESPVSE